MTQALTLDGPWTGLRAFPRGFRTPDTRQRLEAALRRLEHHRERFTRHAERAAAALARIDGLSAGMIDRLDVLDGDPDLEADGCDEPSLAFQEVRPWESQDAAIRRSPTGNDVRFTDLELACEDEGAQCDDEGFDGDREPEADD